MEFKVIESAKDPLFNEALKLYDDKLDIGLDEDSKIFKRSLENNKTENDWGFLLRLSKLKMQNWLLLRNVQLLS